MGTPTKILIIDDDEAVRVTYVEVFKNEGFAVEEAIDGLDGLEKATKNPPQVIFTGIIMPRMDGFGLKEALAKNVATANIPVVMSSHMGRKEDEEKAKTMGIVDFIILDLVTPRQAVERIRRVLGAGEYKVKIVAGELDVTRLAKDFHLNEKFQCSNCGADLVLQLGIMDVGQHEFTAKIICPKCGRI